MDLAAIGDGGWLVGRGLGAGMMDDGTAVDDVDLASGKRARELLLPAPPNDSHQCSLLPAAHRPAAQHAGHHYPQKSRRRSSCSSCCCCCCCC